MRQRVMDSKSRRFIATAVTGFLSACILSLWLASAFVDLSAYRISFTQQLHACLSHIDGAMPRLVLFNDAAYGPYRGSIASIGVSSSEFPQQVIGWGDCLGVYFRHLSSANGRTPWTLAVSLWYPVLLVSAIFALRICANLRGSISRLPPSNAP